MMKKLMDRNPPHHHMILTGHIRPAVQAEAEPVGMVNTGQVARPVAVYDDLDTYLLDLATLPKVYYHIFLPRVIDGR